MCVYVKSWYYKGSVQLSGNFELRPGPKLTSCKALNLKSKRNYQNLTRQTVSKNIILPNSLKFNLKLIYNSMSDKK